MARGHIKHTESKPPLGLQKVWQSVIGVCLLWYMNGKWIEHDLVARNRSYWFFKTFKVPYIAMIYEGLIKNKVIYEGLIKGEETTVQAADNMLSDGC